MDINNTKLSEINFVFFDTETTGDNRNKDDKPIEAAFIKWNPTKGLSKETKEWLIDPGMLIHPSAMAVHGIYNEELVGKPKLESLQPEIENFCKNTVIVAHNIDFDLEMLPFLKDESYTKLDSLKFAHKVYTIGQKNEDGHDLRSYKLQEIKHWLKQKTDTMGKDSHRAIADILVLKDVFSSMLQEFYKKENKQDATWSDFIEFIQRPVLVEVFPIGNKYKDKNILEAIREEKAKGGNYFEWILDQDKIGKMKLQDDLKYSIEYHLKSFPKPRPRF